MRLYEKYRPRTLGDVLGQPKAVKVTERIISNGAGGQAVWLSGKSGTGKTTIARIIAESVADPFYVVEYDSADQFIQAQLTAMAEHMQLFSMGKGGRAWIINEAHGLRAPIVRQLLGILERLPAHCVVIFTTTSEGQEKLFQDEIDASPLLSRCVTIKLTNQGVAPLFAAHLATVATREGLTSGNPLPACTRIIKEEKNNLRAGFQRIESGELL